MKKEINFQNTMMSVLGIEIEQAGPDLVAVTMPVDARTHQPYGMLHGGASVALAETAASTGTMLNIDLQRQAAFGLEINANHLRPKSSGLVRARAVPLYKGRTTMVWDVKITDENEKLVCVARCTMAIADIDRLNHRQA